MAFRKKRKITGTPQLSNQSLFDRRRFLIEAVQYGAIPVLLGRIFYLQIVKQEEYASLSHENRILTRIVLPPRGKIYDHLGNLLVTNEEGFNVSLLNADPKSVAFSLKLLSQLIPLEESRQQDIIQKSRQNEGFSLSLLVLNDVPWKDMAVIEANTPFLNGVMTSRILKRHYLFGEALAHVTGYVSHPSATDINQNPQDDFIHLPEYRIGKTNVEKVFNKRLGGVGGNIQEEVNALRRPIREISHKPEAAGEDLYLALNKDLQIYAYDLMKSYKSASCVLMEIETGEIRAMISSPSFDPNLFINGISQKNWDGYENNPLHPLVNKTISRSYPPASTFKPIVALAALRAGTLLPDTQFECRGSLKVGNDIFHCWKPFGHGRLTVEEALKHSCDIFFYRTMQTTPIDNIIRLAQEMGYDVPTNIRLSNEKTGMIPSPSWKRATYDRPWLEGDSLIFGIGQGDLSVTPIRLAMVAAKLATGLPIHTPRLLDKSRHPQEESDIFEAAPKIDSAIFSLVRQGLYRAVNEAQGTATQARLALPYPYKNIRMAGKTGTAELFLTKTERNLFREDTLGNRKSEAHALFIGFAPFDKPRYAISLVVEHGRRGGAVAGRLARLVMEKAFMTLKPAVESPQAPESLSGDDRQEQS